MKLKDGFIGSRTIIVPQMIVKMMETDPLVSELFVTDIGYYPHAKYHYRERITPIDQYVLIYCLNGKGWYKFDGKERQVSAGEYFILPAGKPHAYRTLDNDPWTIYWIHFKGRLAALYAQGAEEPSCIKADLFSRIKERIVLFEELFNSLRENYSMEGLRYMSSLLHYFLGSIRYVNHFRRSSLHKTDSSDMVGVVSHFMKENIEKRLTIKDIANYLGYSSSYFSGKFKEQTGHSPLSYFNIMKVNEACALLSSTDMKINEICPKVGFDDPYYFSRLFTSIMGLSPTEYRKEVGKG
ncbi:MAG: AraC family transcriptional regulator [Bacteroidales bacterium]|nr:AraC family transcriptional regulator [Bacteroidales bacterium]